MLWNDTIRSLVFNFTRGKFGAIMPDESIQLIPDAPEFSEEVLGRCRETGNYMPVVFEWYKFVSQLAMIIAHIKPESPAFREVPPQHYYVLMGLLNRCARLTLSNVALSHEGKFGETTAIVDRCIFESAIKIIWLCFEPEQEKYNRYLANGLKTELGLKAQILSNISIRDGSEQPIETRMLRSIANHIEASGLTEDEISSARPMPDIASILTALGHDRLLYVVAQKLGSHHVHGTWPSLVFHYIERQSGNSEFEFEPRGHNCDTHVNQFLFTALFLINAMQGYTKYVLDDDSHRAFWGLLEATERKIKELYFSTESE